MNPILYLSIMGIVILFAGLASLIPSYQKLKTDYKNSVKIDISIDEMICSEARITAFYKKHNLQPGTSIRDIARILNVSEGNESQGLQGQARIDEVDANGKMRVTFKTGLTEAQHLFNFAHECAHIINEDPVPATRPDEKNKPQIEQLADYTAAALLMPIEDVYRFLILQKYSTASKNRKVYLVESLCKTYNVSEIIAMRRINEVFSIKNR